MSHKNESLFIFWHVIIFLLLCDNKNISPRHDAKIWCQKQKFDVARKIILCWNKKFDIALKVILVSTEMCWCCSKKYFMSTKEKVDVAQKYISCRQKQDDAASKKHFVHKKVASYFRNRAPYTVFPKQQ